MSDAAQRAVATLLPADRTDLADLVLSTPAAGRGPVDPDTADEPRVRLRAAVSALARWCEKSCGSLATETPGEAAALRFRRRRRSAPVVVGAGLPAPEQVGRRSTLTVVGGPLDAMALAHWQRQVAAGSGVRWRRLWDRMVARDQLAAGLDAAALARHWIDRLGAERVTLVLDPGPASVHPARVDLSRRLNQVLAVRPAGARAAVASLPWPPVPAPPAAGALGVPAHRLRWATQRAERLAEDLAGLDCRTLGDPGVVVPSTGPGVRRSVPAADTLDLAVAVLSGLPRPGASQRGEEGHRG